MWAVQGNNALFSSESLKNCQNFFIKFHSDNFFGLSRIDVNLIGKKNKDWKAPTVAIKITTRDKLGK